MTDTYDAVSNGEDNSEDAAHAALRERLANDEFMAHLQGMT